MVYVAVRSVVSDVRSGSHAQHLGDDLSEWSRLRGSRVSLLLPLGHLEVVERSRKLARDCVELGRRDLQSAMDFFQAERSSALFRSGVLLRSAGNVADPQGAH